MLNYQRVNHGTQLRHPLGPCGTTMPCQEAAPLLGVRADGSGLAHGTGGAMPAWCLRRICDPKMDDMDDMDASEHGLRGIRNLVLNKMMMIDR